MEYITLQHSGLKVSRLCMGGCPMGGYGWGEVDEQLLVDAVHKALDLGVTFFDTADTYGLGQSERTLSKAIGANRKDIVIASKFGVRVENGKTFYDNSPEYIEKAVCGSLERLRTDYIDLYQIHYRDGKTPLSVVADKLEELKRRGMIRAYGLSNIFKDDIDEVKALADRFVSFQDEYSLACRKHEADIFAISEELGLTPMTWGSLGQGILTGKYDRSCTFEKNDRRSRDIYVNFHGEKLEQNLRIVDELRRIAAETGKDVPSVAIRFILDRLPDSVVLAGAKKPSQVVSNAGALDWRLSREQIDRLLEVSA